MYVTADANCVSITLYTVSDADCYRYRHNMLCRLSRWTDGTHLSFRSAITRLCCCRSADTATHVLFHHALASLARRTTVLSRMFWLHFDHVWHGVWHWGLFFYFFRIIYCPVFYVLLVWLSIILAVDDGWMCWTYACSGSLSVFLHDVYL